MQNPLHVHFIRKGDEKIFREVMMNFDVGRIDAEETLGLAQLRQPLLNDEQYRCPSRGDIPVPPMAGGGLR
jgi:hypothetical protein